MNAITFEEYLEDMLDQHPGLMSEQELADARASYKKLMSSSGSGKRTTISAKADDCRKTAKLFGGRALKGTAKQKEWAEKIRADKLQEMTPEQATLVCDPKGLLTHSKFWIENRTRAGKEIGAFIETQKRLLAEHRAAATKCDAAAVASIATQYNKLTDQWGF